MEAAAGSGRYLGEWKIRSRLVRVYEFRYACPAGRFGVRIDYKAKRGDKVFGVLSMPAPPHVDLLPGEFIVKSFDQMKHYWQDMLGFPEFEDTLKRSQLTYRDGPTSKTHVCPLWRFVSHDYMAECAPVLDQGCIPHTGTVEAAYMEIKKLVKGAPTNSDMAQLLIGMKTQDAMVIRDAVMTETQTKDS